MILNASMVSAVGYAVAAKFGSVVKEMRDLQGMVG